MEFLHALCMLICAILCNLWMIFVFCSIKIEAVQNFLGLINTSKHGKILSVLMLVFIMRVWIMATLDVINVVNSIFGIFGCEPMYEF